MLGRVLALGVCAVLIAASCGGSTEQLGTSRSADGSGGSAHGSGGQTAGGSSGQSGTSGALGAGDGAAGTAGAAGGPDCFAEPWSERCGMGGGFYFDPASGTCQTYGSSQCRGSANYFSLRGCLETCPNARPDVDACEFDSECVVVDAGCCATCEPVSQASLIAVNALRAGDYRDPCPPVDCAACPPVDELATTRQYFVPFCSAGKCVVRDIRGGEYTRCSADTDCVLRDGAECCEGCDGRGLVAVNRSGTGLACSNVGCDACTPIIPVEYRALCDGSQCRVTRTVDAGAR